MEYKQYTMYIGDDFFEGYTSEEVKGVVSKYVKNFTLSHGISQTEEWGKEVSFIVTIVTDDIIYTDEKIEQVAKNIKADLKQDAILITKQTLDNAVMA